MCQPLFYNHAVFVSLITFCDCDGVCGFLKSLQLRFEGFKRKISSKNDPDIDLICWHDTNISTPRDEQKRERKFAPMSHIWFIPSVSFFDRTHYITRRIRSLCSLNEHHREIGFWSLLIRYFKYFWKYIRTDKTVSVAALQILKGRSVGLCGGRAVCPHF